MKFNRVFVTVGTTQFEDLIEAVISDEILMQLQQIECKVLKIQYGAGHAIDTATIRRIQSQFSINIDCFNFKENISTDITSSDLIISHAGAGSCIEVLTSKKPLIVVVNDKLMNNHQTELAQQLSIDGYLLCCSPNTLSDALNDIEKKLSSLKSYESGDTNMMKFVDHLNSVMGLV